MYAEMYGTSRVAPCILPRTQTVKGTLPVGSTTRDKRSATFLGELIGAGWPRRLLRTP